MFTASDRGSLVQPALFCFVSSHFPVLLPFNDIGSSQVERRSGGRKIKMTSLVYETLVIVVVVVFTLKAVPISTQYFLTSVLVQLTRTPSVVTG